MKEEPKHIGNINKYLSNLTKTMDRSVLIGFKGLDKVMFEVLNDLVHSSSNYEEVKSEHITFPSSEIPKAGKRHKYTHLYRKFEEEYYDVLVEKAINKDAKVVMLNYQKNNGQLHIDVYYFREGPAY